jgi:hypothetical protein
MVLVVLEASMVAAMEQQVLVAVAVAVVAQLETELLLAVQLDMLVMAAMVALAVLVEKTLTKAHSLASLEVEVLVIIMVVVKVVSLMGMVAEVLDTKTISLYHQVLRIMLEYMAMEQSASSGQELQDNSQQQILATYN